MAEITFFEEGINKRYRKLLNNNTWETLIFGGSSAGKSFFIFSQYLFVKIFKGGHNFLILRKVQRTNKDTTFEQVRQGLDLLPGKLASQFLINKSEMKITAPNGYQIIFRGLDNIDKLKGIKPRRGVITDVVLEEVSETSRDDIKKLKKRIRGLSRVPKTFTYLSNPVSALHWLKTDICDRVGFNIEDKFYQDEYLTIMHVTYKDNQRFLGKEEVRELENEDNPYYRDVYTDGKWGVLGDVCFTNWITDDLSELENPHYHGLDFGDTHPSAYVKLWVSEREKRIYVKRGYYRGKMDFDELVKPLPKDEVVYCDSAEPRTIRTIKKMGVNGARGANKPKGHMTHAIRFLQGYTIVVDKDFVELQNELSLLQWKEDKDGNRIDEPVDKNDHAIQAMVYGLEPVLDNRAGQKRYMN